MPVDRRKVVLYVVAANLRLVLFLIFSGIPDLLTGQVEVSTPLNSFKRCMANAHSQIAAS
jgi:GPI-anchor transamidase subunit U